MQLCAKFLSVRTLCETTGAYLCACECLFVCKCLYVRESKCPLSSGKKMPYGISDYVWRWCTVFIFFPPSPETESPGHCKNSCRMKSEPELWSNLEPKQREKPCRETNSLVLCDLCGVEFHPLFCTVKSVSRWSKKLSVKFMMHFSDGKLIQYVRFWEIFHYTMCVTRYFVIETASSSLIVFDI